MILASGAGTERSDIIAKLDRWLAAITLALCLGVVGLKVILAWRLNVNWDEFYFLNHIYALTRNELTLVLQGAYTHAFTWLTHLPGHEVDQIVAGRLVMVAMLALTAWLVWRLALIGLTGLGAAIAPLVFLTFLPVLEHGGSFRSDSLLAPLSVAALLLLATPGRSVRRDWLAGAILGVAFAVTVKVILFAPLLLVTIVLRSGNGRSLIDWHAAALTTIRVGFAAAAVAALLVGLHWLSIASEQSESIADFATATAGKTLVRTPWFPRADYFLRYFDWQPFPWVLIGAGGALALARRRFDVAALSLSLLPLVFYRNAFPYYFVVMLAPASVLAGWAVNEIAGYTRKHANAWITSSMIAVLWLGVVYQGLKYVDFLLADEQRLQREVIAGIHEIFPQPVNYIDRCGMVSSFRKINFFMSTWGMDAYRERDEAFMPSALETYQPAFVLINTPILGPRYAGRRSLLDEDRRLLASHYVYYWGPVRVAGARVVLEGPEPVRVQVPFAADYRLRLSAPVTVDGRPSVDGDVIHVPSDGVAIARSADGSSEPVKVRLVLASAKPAPRVVPMVFPLFKNL